MTDSDRLKEALAANARIERLPGLRKMADVASRITDGKVHFLYTTQPGATEYYVFQNGGGRYNLKRAIEFLQDVIARPEHYVGESTKP
jgi:hypothetical protein